MFQSPLGSDSSGHSLLAVCMCPERKSTNHPKIQATKINALVLSVMNKSCKFSPFTNVFKCHKCHGAQELPQGRLLPHTLLIKHDSQNVPTGSIIPKII